MHIYLIRHGDARHGSPDEERPLSKRGVEEIEAIARDLQSREVTVDQIWHSPLKRACETAQIISETLGCSNVGQAQSWLKPEDSGQEMVEEVETLEAEGKVNHLIVVTHMPLIESLTNQLVRREPFAHVYSTGAVGVIDFSLNGSSQLVDFLTPDV